MKIIHAKYIITMDKDYTIIEDGGVVFDKKILQVDKIDNILQKYPDVDVVSTPPQSILMPGLINSHIHLEFSSNTTNLEYGDFVKWLRSVIINRDEIMKNLSDALLQDSIKTLIQTGTTTIGAISSNGYDLKALGEADLRVVYFSEAIGSTANAVDALLADFISRYESSKAYKSDRFYPSIAIHSPYAIHPFFTREVLSIAKKDSTRVSAHLLESKAEREWLDSSSGDMAKFFEQFLSQTSSLISSSDFIKQFDEVNTVFTHSLECNSEDITLLNNSNHSIAHCPVSNRLLNNRHLDLNNYSANMALGTDGLSSNISLSLFDEMRHALMIHDGVELEDLAKRLLTMATKNGAKALDLDLGEIQEGKVSDMIVVDIGELKSIKQIYTDIILHTQSVHISIIAGKIHKI